MENYVKFQHIMETQLARFAKIAAPMGCEQV
ncbi:MAG: hypothetical protein ACI88G_002438 [Woeseiaceae bacterium]|jgi:hypothetical protein